MDIIAMYAAGVFILMQTLKTFYDPRPVLKIVIVVVLSSAAVYCGVSHSWRYSDVVTTCGVAGLAILYHRLYAILSALADALRAYVVSVAVRRQRL